LTRRQVQDSELLPPGGGYCRCFYRNAETSLGEYDIAHLAYEIERKDLEMAGGKTGSICSYIWRVNFMEFFDDEKVIRKPPAC